MYRKGEEFKIIKHVNYTWHKLELLLYPWPNAHCMSYFIFLKACACTLDILVVLHTVKLIVVRNEAVVKVVDPCATDGTEKATTVENVVFHCNPLQDRYRFVTFVTAVGSYDGRLRVSCTWLEKITDND